MTSTHGPITALNNINQWRADNKANFSPPICNKLMHKNQLSIMFVGGPNTRTDFHIEAGSEFFFQLQGNMHLPTVQNGNRKVVHILEGSMFLLPARIPHSPQRPETDSFGLVIERARQENEFDVLRWYTNAEVCDELLWEKYFVCRDLGRDLVPVVAEFKSSPSCASNIPAPPLPESEIKLKQDTQTIVPNPIVFADLLAKHKDTLEQGGCVDVFGEGHPCKETKVWLVGGKPQASSATTATASDDNQHQKQQQTVGEVQVWKGETWLYQHAGSAVVSVLSSSSSASDNTKDNSDENNVVELREGCCCVVSANTRYCVKRESGSVGLVVTMFPSNESPSA
eukprot:c9297_g1_i1.p1 GENE.c9297_g1_i1~~c9297_g1_i1.p1  ORF type:complete len:357 (+),score=103.36 c9297_g1_i1:54-1073(+)